MPCLTMQSGARTPCRVSQLRQEEGMDERGKEAAGEKLLHSALRMSQSWEDLSLVRAETVPIDRVPFQGMGEAAGILFHYFALLISAATDVSRVM